MNEEQFERLLLILQEGSSASWWPLLIPAAATLIAAAIAILLALRQLRVQQEIATRRNTIDLIMKFEADPVYREAVKTYREFRDGQIRKEDIIPPRNAANREHLDRLNSFWNFHEAICLGLRRRVVDEELFRRWWGEPLVDIWNTSVPVFNDLRRDRNTLRIYQHFEIVGRHFAGTLTQKGYTKDFVEPDRKNEKPFLIASTD